MLDVAKSANEKDIFNQPNLEILIKKELQFAWTCGHYYFLSIY